MTAETNKKTTVSKVHDQFYMEENKTKPPATPTLSTCLKSIKDKCLSCKRREILEVLDCKAEDCPLFTIKHFITTKEVKDAD